MLTICGNHINAEHPQPVILPSSSLTGSLCFVHSEYAAQCQCDNRDIAAEQKSNSSLESAAVKACCGESHCGHARSSLMAKGNDKYVKAYLCADLGCLFSICQCLLSICHCLKLLSQLRVGELLVHIQGLLLLPLRLSNVLLVLLLQSRNLLLQYAFN